MLVKKNLSGVRFETVSARGARRETEKDQALRAELSTIHENFNREQEKNGKPERFAGYCIGFEVDGKIYAALFDTETALQRVKWDSEKKILQPIGTQQVRDFVTQDKMDYICTLDELNEYTRKMHHSNKNRGIAFQKYLEKISGYKVKTDFTASKEQGGDKYRVGTGLYEVKFMRLGNTQGSCKV